MDDYIQDIKRKPIGQLTVTDMLNLAASDENSHINDIGRLNAEVNKKCIEIRNLEDEIERLRSALAKFADVDNYQIYESGVFADTDLLPWEYAAKILEETV